MNIDAKRIEHSTIELTIGENKITLTEGDAKALANELVALLDMGCKLPHWTPNYTPIYVTNTAPNQPSWQPSYVGTPWCHSNH